MSRISELGFTHVQSCEVQHQFEGRMIPLSFDGKQVTLDHSVIHVFEADDAVVARSVLYRVCESPDTLLAGEQLRPNGKPYAASRLEDAQAFFGQLFERRLGRNPVELVYERMRVKGMAPKIGGVILHTQVDIEREKARRDGGRVDYVLEKPINYQEQNNAHWVLNMQMAGGDFMSTRFELMHADTITILSILNSRTGNELGLEALRMEYAERTHKKVSPEDFVEIMQRTVYDYGRFPECKSRIHFARRGNEGVFTWRMPRYRAS